jgi:hypothetical protein
MIYIFDFCMQYMFMLPWADLRYAKKSFKDVFTCFNAPIPHPPHSLLVMSRKPRGSKENSSAPSARSKGKKQAVSDEQYEEFLKFQAQKKKEEDMKRKESE